MNNNLTPFMQHAIDFAKANGNKLHRHPGGYWSDNEWRGRWQKSFGTTTVHALVTRGIAQYTKCQQGRSGKFPIEATLINADGKSLTADSN